MFEFKTIQILNPDVKILEVIKDYNYKIKKEKLKFFYILTYKL